MTSHAANFQKLLGTAPLHFDYKIIDTAYGELKAISRFLAPGNLYNSYLLEERDCVFHAFTAA